MHGIIFLFAAVFIVIVVVGARLAGRRRKLLRTWAQGKGWRFRQDKDRDMRETYDFDCLQRGHSRYAYNICEGQWHDLPVRTFDYHYTTGSGKNRSDHTFSAVILGAPAPLKRMLIRPEGVFDKVTAFFGLDDIDFESAEFSRRFYVKADDRRWAYDVIHQRTMDFLLSSPEYSIAFDRDCVIAWRDRRLQPEQFDQAMALVKGILDRLPDYLVQRQRQEV